MLTQRQKVCRLAAADPKPTFAGIVPKAWTGRIRNGRFGVPDATSRRSVVEIVNGNAVEI